MTDARLTAAFATFDLPVEPDPAFAERLFEDLAADLGLRPDRAPRGLRRRLRRAVGLEPMPTGPAARRLAYLAAAVGLLFAAALLAIAVGSLLRREERLPVRLSAAELVRLSQAATRQPPLLVEEITGPPGTWRLGSDGTGTWRAERIASAEGPGDGSFDLFRAGRLGHYDASARTWSTTDGGVPGFPFNGEFMWIALAPDGSGGATQLLYDCADPRLLPDQPVVQRPADHLVCASNMEFWLDKETHLVLRIMAGQGTPNWDPGVGVTVTSLTLGGDVDRSPFAWTGPPGSFDAANPPPSTVLQLGAPAPRWTGTYADGRPFDSSTMRLPAALYFWSPQCPPSSEMYPDMRAEAVTNPTIDTVFVAMWGLGTAVGYASEHPPGVPILDDGEPLAAPGAEDHSLMKAWGLSACPALVLLGPDGDVSAILIGTRHRAELDALFAAFAAGAALPSYAPMTTAAPEPSVTPTPPVAFAVGAHLPSWSGPLLGGGHLASAELLGKPAIVWSWDGGNCTNCETSDIAAFDALAKEVDGRVTLVVLSAGEMTPGWTKDLAAKLGLTVSIVFDWDGAIAASLWPDGVLGGYLAADSAGRLIATGTSGPTRAEVLAIVGR